MDWKVERVLVVGKNYPALSEKHVELSCTGGLREADGHRLIRLHPIPYRLLGAEQRFSTWQWIEARICKDPVDTRPESFRIDANTINLREQVPSTRPAERRRLIEACPSHFGSVHELEAQQEKDRTSLGIVRPREITKIEVKRRTVEQNADWVDKEKALRDQMVLFDDVQAKPLDPPGADFLVHWLCMDPACPGHSMGLHQWGIHQLWRRYENDGDAVKLVEDAMRKRMELTVSDLYFFLGNYKRRPRQFGLMEVATLKIQDQFDGPSLFA